MASTDERVDLAALAAGIVDGTAEEHATHDVPAVEPGDVDALTHVAEDSEGPPLREILKRWGYKPLAILFSLNVLDELDRYAVVTLAPDIRADLGLSNAAMGGLSALGAIVVVTLGLPFGVLADRGRSRPTIAGVAGILWGGAVLCTALVQNALQLGLAIMFSGLGKASV